MPNQFFFADQRYQRVLKHRSALQFPTESEIKKLSDLADVKGPRRSSFEQNIRNLIMDAHQNDSLMKGRSASDVKKAIASVAKQAAQLSATLRQMDLKIAGGKGGSSETAGMYLEYELAKIEQSLFPLYPALLDLLHAAATRAETLSKYKRGPKGAGGNQAFDKFVEQLSNAAEVQGVKWSCHRAKDQTWTGPILDALKLLKPYLPPHFFPSSELGRAVKHIQEKLEKKRRQHT